MKTIEVFVLQTYHGELVNVSVTASSKEAYDWWNASSRNDYETHKLTLTQEIQVQSDY